MHTVFIDGCRVKVLSIDVINSMIFDGLTVTHAKNCKGCK